MEGQKNKDGSGREGTPKGLASIWGEVARYPLALSVLFERGLLYQSKIFFREWIVAARPPRAMAVVKGRSLGHTLTQFWALPQT